MKRIIIGLIIYTALCFLASGIEKKIEGHKTQNLSVANAKVISYGSTNKNVTTRQASGKKEVSKPIIRKQQNNETREQAEEKQKYVDYIWNKGKDFDMVLTFEFESGLNPNALNKNYKKDANGNLVLDKKGNKIVDSTDHGLTQLNSDYHMAFIQSENFKDPYKQLDYGIKLYQDYKKRGIIGKRFYGYNYRARIRSRYIISQEAVNITYGIK